VTEEDEQGAAPNARKGKTSIVSHIIGIDLGTTTRAWPYWKGWSPGDPQSEGSRTTPRHRPVGEGEPLVGQIAKRQAVTNSECTVSAIKR